MFPFFPAHSKQTWHLPHILFPQQFSKAKKNTQLTSHCHHHSHTKLLNYYNILPQILPLTILPWISLSLSLSHARKIVCEVRRRALRPLSRWHKAQTHMDEEQHGRRKSSTIHPHELHICMRPCGWEYHKRAWMKKQHCGWQISTNNLRGVNICIHPSRSQKHMDEEIFRVDEIVRRIICLDFTFVCIHVDERITNAYGWRNCVVDEIVRRIIHMELHFMHPCAWENHNAHGWRNIVLDEKMTSYPRERNICMHPCGWENHESIWMKKQHCGRNSSTNHRHGVAFVCIHVDERITNPHGWRNSVVDEIVRRIIDMDFTFAYSHADGDSGSRSSVP